jgi:hypothetical protein
VKEDSFIGGSVSLNAADVPRATAAELLTELQAERLRQDLAWVLSASQGRRFIDSILSMCGVYRSSVADNPHLVYLSEGSRNIGLQLIARLGALAPNAYLTIQAERIQQQADDMARAEVKASSLAVQ